MYTFGFVMEQTLGHVTHHKNLARWVAEDPEVCPIWMPVEAARNDLWERLPVVRGNWSLKASLRARDALRETVRRQHLDALFLHTQTVALYAIPFMQRVPTIVSLDATPINYDSVGGAYGHRTNLPGWVERRKFAWNRATFRAATALVTWCQWAKDSLVRDYGISPEKVTVVPPGVDLEQWDFGQERADRPQGTGEKLRLLFVGADFVRKGGEVLLKAFRNGLHPGCELDIVTRFDGVHAMVAGMEGVRVHCNLTANSAPLKALYARADLFVFPTLADCLPIAVMEAMAAGLPVVTTGVGALREEVEDGVNGLIVPPGDPEAIVRGVQILIDAPSRRRAMGRAGRQMAEERFNARRNYGAILQMMKQLSGARAYHPATQPQESRAG